VQSIELSLNAAIDGIDCALSDQQLDRSLQHELMRDSSPAGRAASIAFSHKTSRPGYAHPFHFAKYPIYAEYPALFVHFFRCTPQGSEALVLLVSIFLLAFLVHSGAGLSRCQSSVQSIEAHAVLPVFSMLHQHLSHIEERIR